MEKRALYTYNPETDDFERYYPTLKSKLIKWGAMLLMSACFGVLMFVIVWFGILSNSEADLRRENSRLKSQYNVLERRVDASVKVLESIRNRDDNFYRVMMQMDPMSAGRRYAGIDYEKGYSSIRRLDNYALTDRLSQEVDLLDRLLYSQSQSFDQLRDQLEIQNKRVSYIPAILPLGEKKTEIASGFGARVDPVNAERIFHNGIDFVADIGTPVYATADGKIEIAERKGVYGNCIEISHGDNYLTRYAHLSEMTVKPGATVKRGDIIGRVGSTGKSSQPHLHYEVWYKNEVQDPVNFCFLDLTPKEYSELARTASDAGQVLD